MTIFDAIKIVCETNPAMSNIIAVLVSWVIYSSIAVAYVMFVSAIDSEDKEYVAMINMFQLVFIVLLHFAYKCLIDAISDHPENDIYNFWFILMGVVYAFCLSLANMTLLITVFFKKRKFRN